MMRMTQVQGSALAALLNRLRPEWDNAGILHAIGQAAGKADAWTVAHAALTLAADPNIKTPALLPQDGHWWAHADTSSGATHAPRTQRCAAHQRPRPCGECAQAERDAIPMPDYVRAALPKVTP